MDGFHLACNSAAGAKLAGVQEMDSAVTTEAAAGPAQFPRAPLAPRGIRAGPSGPQLERSRRRARWQRAPSSLQPSWSPPNQRPTWSPPPFFAALACPAPPHSGLPCPGQQHTHVHNGVRRRRVQHLRQQKGCTAQLHSSVPTVPSGRRVHAMCTPVQTASHVDVARADPPAPPPAPASSLVRNTRGSTPLRCHNAPLASYIYIIVHRTSSSCLVRRPTALNPPGRPLTCCPPGPPLTCCPLPPCNRAPRRCTCPGSTAVWAPRWLAWGPSRL